MRNETRLIILLAEYKKAARNFKKLQEIRKEAIFEVMKDSQIPETEFEILLHGAEDEI